MKRHLMVVATVLAIALAGPTTSAFGVSGAITSATATPDWTTGSWTASVTYDLCASRLECKWSALLTAQPTTYQCDANDPLPSGDRNVSLVSAVQTQTTNGTHNLDRQNYPIIRGVYGQRLCLYVWEQGKIQRSGNENPLCSPAFPQFCVPYVDELYFFYTVASRIFTVQQPPLPAATPPAQPTSGGQPVQGEAIVFTASLAKSKARSALKKKYGRAYKRGKRKRLTCKRRSSNVYRCAFSFRYKKRKRAGIVTLRATSSGIKASVKARN